MSEEFNDVIYPENKPNLNEEVKEQVQPPKQITSNQPSSKNMYHSYDIWGFMFEVPQWTIKVNANEILFSGDIIEGSMLELIHAIDKVFETIQRLKLKTGYELPLRLVINSPGGSVKSGFMAIDYIKSLPIEVETYVLGQAASMGFMLWLVGDKRDMSENSSLLIHQLRTGFMGRKDEFEDYMKHIQDLHKQLVGFTVRATGLSKDTVESLFARETWLTKKDAAKLGLLK